MSQGSGRPIERRLIGRVEWRSSTVVRRGDLLEKGTDEVPDPRPSRSARRASLGAARRPEAPHAAVLGVLLLHANEAVSIDRLVDELWGERPPATAAKLVQGYIHALRKQLDGQHPRHTGPRVPAACRPGRARPARVPATHRQGALRSVGERRGAEAKGARALAGHCSLADVVFHGPARHEVGRLSELHLATRSTCPGLSSSSASTPSWSVSSSCSSPPIRTRSDCAGS